MLHPAVLKSRQQKKRLVGIYIFQHDFLSLTFSRVNSICFFLMIPIGLFCFQRLQNIYSDIYSRVLSSTRPYQALTIKDKNKQNDLSDKTFTFLQRISSLFPFQKCLATGHNPEDEDVFQLDESSPPSITPVASQILLQTLCLKAFTKTLPKAPAHLQPPPGSTCC